MSTLNITAGGGRVEPRFAGGPGDGLSTETLASIGVASVLALGVFAWALSRQDSHSAYASDSDVAYPPYKGRIEDWYIERGVFGLAYPELVGRLYDSPYYPQGDRIAVPSPHIDQFAVTERSTYRLGKECKNYDPHVIGSPMECVGGVDYSIAAHMRR